MSGPGPFGRGAASTHLTHLTEPAFADPVSGVGMIFENISQVVCHGTAQVQLRVVLQKLEQRRRQIRVLLELLQSRGPWQARPRPFADESSDMRAGVSRPDSQLSEAFVTVSDQKRPNAGFGGKSSGNLVIGVQRQIKCAA